MGSEAGHRLYVKGRHISYARGKRNTTPGVSLIQIEGVSDTKGANFYLGKKVAFVYRASKEVRGSKIRVIWGTISRTHGNSGMVRAKFRNNLPPKSFGASDAIPDPYSLEKVNIRVNKLHKSSSKL
ncbi:60S ribosomal protein L33 [Diplocarpon mali]|nr:60S ribosomal protein L33 [Diplocarpon mali]